jgi:hypothetical protein
MPAVIYDVAPGALLEHDGPEPLTQEELDQARADYADGTKLETIAKRLKAKVFEPPTIGARHVVVDLEALERVAAIAELDDETRAELGLPLSDSAEDGAERPSSGA